MLQVTGPVRSTNAPLSGVFAILAEIFWAFFLTMVLRALVGQPRARLPVSVRGLADLGDNIART